MFHAEPGWQDSVLAAAARYDAVAGPFYDEVFSEVAQRIATAGSVGKTDIAALAVWKRSARGSRWIARLMATPDTDVRSCTAAALRAREDSDRLRLLAPIPGLAGGPIATAVLCASNPDDFAVMDRRALAGLRAHGGFGFPFQLRGRARTVAYLKLTRQLRDEIRQDRVGFSARDVDKALYVLGG